MTFYRAVGVTAWTVFMLIVVGLFSVGAVIGDCADPIACKSSKQIALSIVIVGGAAIYGAGILWMIRRRRG